ncbi:MAG: hypothetical protein IJ037_09690, partial [Clostridia bacterium]|nr:hypothetical protein [Clostridia bacterium]
CEGRSKREEGIGKNGINGYLYGAREPKLTNNLSSYITQSLHGCGEWGLGGPHELENDFLGHWTSPIGCAP